MILVAAIVAVAGAGPEVSSGTVWLGLRALESASWLSTWSPLWLGGGVGAFATGGSGSEELGSVGRLRSAQGRSPSTARACICTEHMVKTYAAPSGCRRERTASAASSS